MRRIHAWRMSGQLRLLWTCWRSAYMHLLQPSVRLRQSARWPALHLHLVNCSSHEH